MSPSVTRSLGIFASLTGALAVIFAIAPWFGDESNKLDRLASFFPIAVPLALLTIFAAYAVSRTLALLYLLLIAVLIAIIAFPEYFPKHHPQSTDAAQLTIVSHNLKGFNFDPPGTAKALVESGADVLLLQEWGSRIAPFRPVLDKKYPFGGGCGGEFLILSRYPIGPVQCLVAYEAPAWQTIAWASLTLADGTKAILATTHPSWRPGRLQRIKTRHMLVENVRKLPHQHLILAGDFNITPWNEGMRDLDAQLKPVRRVTRAMPTFPARFRGKNWPIPFLPIDHAFVGVGWQTVAVERLERTGSDHYPIRIKLRLANKTAKDQ